MSLPPPPTVKRRSTPRPCGTTVSQREALSQRSWSHHHKRIMPRWIHYLSHGCRRVFVRGCQQQYPSHGCRRVCVLGGMIVNKRSACSTPLMTSHGEHPYRHSGPSSRTAVFTSKRANLHTARDPITHGLYCDLARNPVLSRGSEHTLWCRRVRRRPDRAPSIEQRRQSRQRVTANAAHCNRRQMNPRVAQPAEQQSLSSSELGVWRRGWYGPRGEGACLGVLILTSTTRYVLEPKPSIASYSLMNSWQYNSCARQRAGDATSCVCMAASHTAMNRTYTRCSPSHAVPLSPPLSTRSTS